MEPLNKKERVGAFWKFFGAFLVLTLIIILASYLAYVVPDVQLEQLQQENQALQANMPQTDKVLKLLQEIHTVMDSYVADSSNDPIKGKEMTDKLTSDITKLQEMTSDSTGFGQVQRNTAYAYAGWYYAQKKIKGSSGGTQTMIDLQKKLDDCQKEKKELGDDYKTYKELHPAAN